MVMQSLKNEMPFSLLVCDIETLCLEIQNYCKFDNLKIIS